MSVHSLASTIDLKNLWKYKGDEGIALTNDDRTQKKLRKKLGSKLEKILDEDEDEIEDHIDTNSNSPLRDVRQSTLNNI